MTQHSRIAAVQMVSGPDIAQNLRDADRLVAEAAARGAQLVALPEYFPLISGNDMDKVHAREKEGAGPLQDFLRETAVRRKVWLVGGSIPLEAAVPDKVRNSCLVFDDAGRRVARYDKIHLFGFHRGTEHYNESQTIEHGGEVVAFDSPVGRVGLSICYDLRFPELYRAMGPVDLLVVPAAFTHTTGQAHWEVLLRARAVENLCYVLAAAQGGTHPSGRMTWGDSMVVDPWGGVLDRLAQGPGVVTAEMDPARIAELRASLPALEHRRFI
ncbi:MAG: carbon-nitrogen hydrolase family protein [Rhodocyclaceae bacterium]|nr:carbon-nitrogen hydrolase family protein [Rhodocyclaceae bacterium]